MPATGATIETSFESKLVLPARQVAVIIHRTGERKPHEASITYVGAVSPPPPTFFGVLRIIFRKLLDKFLRKLRLRP